jgi:transcriptional regulator with XRE-family HTH domain
MEMVMKVNVPAHSKRLREEKSLSQEHLAEASGISLRTIQRGRPRATPRPRPKLALAATLGVDVWPNCKLPGARTGGWARDGGGWLVEGGVPPPRHPLYGDLWRDGLDGHPFERTGDMVSMAGHGMGVGLLSHGLRVLKAFQKK